MWHGQRRGGAVLGAAVAAIAVMAGCPGIEYVTWVKTYGAEGVDELPGLTRTHDGGFLLGGTTESAGAGGRDFYIVKTDNLGNEVWSNTFGGILREDGEPVLDTSDGGYLIAGFTTTFGAGDTDMYLVKTDAAGNKDWSRTYGGPEGEKVFDIESAFDGGFALGGYTESFGAGQTDMYLVKTNRKCRVQWSKTYGWATDERAYGMDQCAAGGYFLAGNSIRADAVHMDIYVVRTDVDGVEIWGETYDAGGSATASAVTETSNGGCLVTGRTYDYDVGEYDIYVIKLEADGDTEWSRILGGAYDDRAYAGHETADGGYIVVGTSEDRTCTKNDMYIAKLNAVGAPVWSTKIGGSENDTPFNVLELPEGGYVIAGSTESFGAGSSDGILVKITPSGRAPSSYELEHATF
ncbi:MAG: hypothetical protein IT364_05575 [Candidatus Hydrogenedentes bacterium]|nr:hypothetical protein [Candidatus Hydrogenedentota bacterium]